MPSLTIAFISSLLASLILATASAPPDLVSASSTSQSPAPTGSPSSIIPPGGPVFSSGEIGGKLKAQPLGNWTCGSTVYTPDVILATGDHVLNITYGVHLRDYILSPAGTNASDTRDPRFNKPYSYPWAVSAYDSPGISSRIFTLAGDAQRRAFFRLLSECTLYPSDTVVIAPIFADGSFFNGDATGPGHERIMFDRKGNFCAVLTDAGQVPYHFAACTAQIEKGSAIDGFDPDAPQL